ncbi:lysophospholipid acyltransferase family protein [Hamadaea tsunoensis]|uniref:lysophospholipid acyltransferase family protein n=1 Tax=Hamadaea tsunoensis TaxID=53368 RepID=UPI000552C78B|nr:lysophospholipid acyltransferase family protein [Hamadaea tsunoensis]
MADPVGAVMRAGVDRLVRGGLRGIWLRETLPAGPFVWAANHHSWWDPFVAFAVLARLRRPACLLMRADNLTRYAFARRLGVFAASEPRTGLRHLDEGRVLILFPEAELRTPGATGPLAAGAAWYALRTGVPLQAVAVRVAMRGHQAPEAYASTATVDLGDTGHLTEATRRLRSTLDARLAELDAELNETDARCAPAGFRLVVRGKRSWDERLTGEKR